MKSFSADILQEEKFLNNVQSNTRATWKVLNEILNRSKRNSNRWSTCKADDREIIDPVKIANKFCSNFSSIGPNLARGIQLSASCRSFLNGCFKQSISFNPTTQDEITKIAKTFLPGKAAGYDQIRSPRPLIEVNFP